jgi:hypothetical protein
MTLELEIVCTVLRNNKALIYLNEFSINVKL